MGGVYAVTGQIDQLHFGEGRQVNVCVLYALGVCAPAVSPTGPFPGT